MAINRVTCPECGATLKSTAGFKRGATVGCPKCKADFVVEDPDQEDERPKKKGSKATVPITTIRKKPVKAVVEEGGDDEEDERPKKKKKKRRSSDEEDWSYRNSWIRYAILTVLIIVMCVLGYLLHLKQKREAQNASRSDVPVICCDQEGTA
ncbi:MAG: hypothetical protein C0467_08120 [Planctomycetaceae bacterium]|nr:hypothetical protein [Planctomycetaceae bacterium]